MNRSLGTALVGLLLVVSSARAQSREIAPAIDRALEAPALKNALVGVLVRSLDTGRVLYERNADFALIPASNLKIVTATAALSLLGPDFRYRTRLLRTGVLRPDGTLTGDLYLRGAGDPSLDFARLNTIAADLRRLGVVRLAGRIVADASRFSGPPLGEGWQWDDESFAYSPQVSALCCDGNTLTVTVQPGEKVGDVGRVSLASDYVRAVSTVSTVAGGARDLDFDRVRGQNVVTVAGSIGATAAPATMRLTVEEPARYTASRLAQALAAVGIGLSSPLVIETGVTPPQAKLLLESPSRPLSDLVRTFMKSSDNLYGECLLRTLGAEKGSGGSAVEGARVAQRWLETRALDTSGLVIADGSGLSRMSTLTARFLVALLADSSRTEPFVRALPVGGVDGTLKSRFTEVAGKVQAKTGTLTGVASLSGYVTTLAGERLAFSMLACHFARDGGADAVRSVQDALIRSLVPLPR
jgi:D-alanyl-D-alanine carboxypeptidase/D-alanyl-D-alanine-endopeptidase (penicillin-binding protein 4)